ncbi:uncharacterized protein LAESUDRAFT_715659 [Laetiporus sulphureus 93-53]|uniref:Uncharacterized protein n=1 Tax=Laetiporus sulphureus 93-53 TaxID=1314785 RepID=A0A165D9F1_9APHY|nr:uncharacterized protein LAESUDRAFT_715659 [Laetiporus sulphureus 93-53]KZT04378.1 hypothetical protein LAESUDRAFT_715659 [Laetiporus sulphureus 93-53]
MVRTNSGIAQLSRESLTTAHKTVVPSFIKRIHAIVRRKIPYMVMIIVPHPKLSKSYYKRRRTPFRKPRAAENTCAQPEPDQQSQRVGSTPLLKSPLQADFRQEDQEHEVYLANLCEGDLSSGLLSGHEGRLISGPSSIPSLLVVEGLDKTKEEPKSTTTSSLQRLPIRAVMLDQPGQLFAAAGDRADNGSPIMTLPTSADVLHTSSAKRVVDVDEVGYDAVCGGAIVERMHADKLGQDTAGLSRDTFQATASGQQEREVYASLSAAYALRRKSTGYRRTANRAPDSAFVCNQRTDWRQDSARGRGW